jgi:hypothetical protein
VRFVDDVPDPGQLRFVLALSNKDDFISGHAAQMAGEMEILAGEVLVD